MQTFYVKAESKIESDKTCVTIADVAQVLCEDNRAQQKAKELVLYEFKSAAGKGRNSSRANSANVQRTVIDVMDIIKLLHARFPGCAVEILGETAIVVELNRTVAHPFWETCKIGLVALLCFFGAAFTIMAFHNDISIEDIFAKVYLLMTGKESNGFTVLEVSYSVGLTAGILLFFNHIGKRRITKDPTPIEVQMRQYEGDVVTAVVENADREKDGGSEA